jgi:hypothetical protein
VALSGSPASAQDWRKAPVVPRLDPGLRRHLRRDLRAGGGRPGVFAKVGDSISASPQFLTGLACHEQNLATHRDVGQTIRWFHRTRFPDSFTTVRCGYADSFSRLSAAVRPYQCSGFPVDPTALKPPQCGPDESPLDCEYRLLDPAFSVAMIGTNDAALGVAESSYCLHVRQMIRASDARGVILILSTLPPRLDYPPANRAVEGFNEALHRIARRRKLPLINLWRAFNGPEMINHGLAADGVHPSAYVSPSGERLPLDFHDYALRYGHNRRNLITLRTLDRLRRVAIRRAGADRR